MERPRKRGAAPPEPSVGGPTPSGSDLNRRQLTSRVDHTALRVAVRAAIFMPASLVTARLLLGEEAQTFAAFGAFVALTMVPFAGRAASRAIAWALLAAAGCVLIAIGTAASTVPVAAVAVAGLASFLIFFGGVVNPYVAAARQGAILLLALPLMVPGDPSEIGIRVAGWLLACGICVPATFLLWRVPWISDLRHRSAAACGELAGLMAEPESQAAASRSRAAVWEMVRSFTDTPSRPTGSAGSSASISRLIDRLSWLYDLAALSEGEDRPVAGQAALVRKPASDLLSACRAVLAGEAADLRTGQLERALSGLEASTDQRVLALAESGGSGPGDEARSLRHLFRVVKMGRVTLEVADAVEVIGERERAMGLGRRLRTWATAWAPEEARAAGRMIRHHSALRSTWLRNSIRGAAGIALAVLIAELLAVQNAFWVVLGTLSILRSDALGTRRSALRAMFGTIAGIALAAVCLVAIGSDETLLWACFPVAVLIAVYARKALSFGTGQAGFAAMVIILYNLTAPVGWEIGLVRVQDVAISCGICLLVGFLIWPRGATALIRDSLAASYREAAALLAHRARRVLAPGADPGGTDPEGDGLQARAVTANARLDAALRQFLDEPGRDPLKGEDLIALCAGGIRLTGTAAEIDRIRSAEWFDPSSGAGSAPLGRAIESVSGWYRSAGDLLGAGRPLPGPVSLPDERGRDLGSGPADPGGTLASFWVGESIGYLAELSERYVERSRRLQARGGEDRPG